VDYRNVKSSAADLAEMLKHTGGERRVPVIVEGGRVTIGYGGT
jgi:glutaredoxin